MMAKTEVNAVDQTTLRTAGLGRGWPEGCAALVLDASEEEQERARSINSFSQMKRQRAWVEACGLK